jgi:enoyl-CoA hydratase/carnithine racemase
MAAVNLGSKFLRGNLENGVLTVTLDRPERRNACTIEMYHGIKQAAVIAEKDASVDVLLITGTGDVFCPGGDMAQQPEGDSRLDAETDRWDLVPFVQLERCPKIVVCAVNGLCQGGGLDIVLSSDVSVASDRAEFRAPELLRGIADCWLSARLTAHVGVARAKYLLFCAATVGAAEAVAMGLVAKAVPHAELARAAAEVIAQIRLTAPVARSHLKRDVNRGLPPIDLGIFTDSLASEEFAEGFRAFTEKRPPRWARTP